MPGIITQYGNSTVSQEYGTFVQGSTATFILRFFDIDGNTYDPSSMTIEILDPADTVLTTQTGCTKIDIGEYAFDYYIQTTATTGTYTLRYTFVTETTTGTESRTLEEMFLVIEASSASSQVAESQRILMRSYLETLIRSTQRIPVKNEQVIWDKNRQLAKLTFGNWNQPAGARIYRNNNLITNGYSVDYIKGEIYFDNPLEKTDLVNVDYNFRWFSDNELDVFMRSSIQVINAYPPQTGYKIGTTPELWVFFAMKQAAVEAIRTIILDLIHQQPQIVLGGPDMAQKMADQLDSVKKNFEEELKTILDLKKYGPYAGLMNMTVTPEYALPGGRCIAGSSVITANFNDKTHKTTVSELYDLYNLYIQSTNNVYTNDKNITVLSDNNGVLSFEKISKIWKTGKKEVIRIIDTENNQLDVSKEHIIFINEKEVPAERVKIGDELTVVKNSQIQKSTVIKIEQLQEVDTFDLEIPSTANLFANNIKCHNSRWFRYLFANATG